MANFFGTQDYLASVTLCGPGNPYHTLVGFTRLWADYHPGLAEIKARLQGRWSGKYTAFPDTSWEPLQEQVRALFGHTGAGCDTCTVWICIGGEEGIPYNGNESLFLLGRCLIHRFDARRKLGSGVLLLEGPLLGPPATGTEEMRTLQVAGAPVELAQRLMEQYPFQVRLPDPLDLGAISGAGEDGTGATS